MAKQQQLLEQVQAAHTQFMQQRTSSTLLQAKEAAVKRLRDAVNHFREIKSNITYVHTRVFRHCRGVVSGGGGAGGGGG